MKHSKQLTVLLAMILVLLIFGIVFYLYLLALDSKSLSQQPGEVATDVEEVGTPELTEQETRARLEAVMSAQPQPSAASTTESFNRLQAVMGSQPEPETNPDEVRARLEAVMSNN